MLENKSEVFKHISFTDALGSLVSDVLAALARGEMTNDGSDANALLLLSMCQV